MGVGGENSLLDHGLGGPGVSAGEKQDSVLEARQKLKPASKVVP